MRYYLGPKEGRDCRFWSDEKREAKGCGGSCECPGMQDGLHRWHKYRDLMNLYEHDKLGLDDLWDEDWSIIAHMMRCKANYKQEKAEEAERIKNLLGNRSGKLR